MPQIDKSAPEKRLENIPVLCIRELARGLDFYRKLGFILETEHEGRAVLSRNHSRLQLRIDADAWQENVGGAPHFYVDCADTFLLELVALDIVVRDQSSGRPWRMREFSVRDPDGNLLRFGEKFQDGVYS